MGIIYMIRNKKNDKRYIGQTQQSIEKRFKQHTEAAYSKNKPTYKFCLSRAIRKYGADNFQIGILADNVPNEDLDLVEAHYIDMYDSIAPNGYNMSPGFNDTKAASDVVDMIPEETYEDNAKVIIDEISDDEIDAFLRDL